MEVISTVKYIRISPKKVMLLAKKLENTEALKALDTLKFVPKKAALPLAKVIKTAVSDAKHNFKLKDVGLTIKSIEVQEGPRLKRIKPRSRGMTHPILKRTSHIKVTLQS